MSQPPNPLAKIAFALGIAVGAFGVACMLIAIGEPLFLPAGDPHHGWLTLLGAGAAMAITGFITAAYARRMKQ